MWVKLLAQCLLDGSSHRGNSNCNAEFLGMMENVSKGHPLLLDWIDNQGPGH